MFRTWWNLLLVLPALLLVSPSSVSAELIGVGLDWRTGIFVQEYWEKGAPRDLLANHSKAPIEITVFDFDSKWRLGQPLGKVQAGPWKVAAGSHSIVDAKPLLAGGLRRFVIGGVQPLGVLRSPTATGTEGPGIETSQGLNGSGGGVPGVFVVQPKTEFESGGTAKVVLHFPSRVGTLKIARMPEAINDPMRPVALVVEKVECDSLNIARDDKQIAIDTNTPKKDAAAHQVTLTFVLPTVKSSQLVMFDFWLANSMGGGSGVTRGLWVVAP